MVLISTILLVTAGMGAPGGGHPQAPRARPWCEMVEDTLIDFLILKDTATVPRGHAMEIKN